MGEPSSTLSERVEDLTAMQKIAGLGSGFSQDEKDEFFQTKPKVKLGLLRSKELDTRITIFTEVFDFSRRTKAKVEFLDASICGYKDPVNADASGNTTDASGNTTDASGNTTDASANPLPAKSNAGSQTNSANADADANAKAEDNPPEELFDTYGNSPTDVSDNLVGTSTEFENLYLAWLQEGGTPLEKGGTPSDKEGGTPSEDEKEKIKSVMKSLFRFIFGTKKIKDLSKMHDKFRYAYTSFKPEEKLPCNPEVLEHFRRCIEYRHGLVTCELSASRQIGVPEYAIYMEAKKSLKFGLYHLLQMLSEGGGFCMEYGGELPKEDNTSRILQIFRKFVQKRKEDPTPTDEDVLKDDLRNPERFPIKPWTPIYNDLIELLKWSADEAEVKRLRAYVQMLAAFIVYKPELDKFEKSTSDFKKQVDSKIDDGNRALADLKGQLENPSLTQQQREILQRLHDSIDAQVKRFSSMKHSHANADAHTNAHANADANIDSQQGGGPDYNQRLKGLMGAFQIEGSRPEPLKENINVPKVMLTALLLKTNNSHTQLEEHAKEVLNTAQRPLMLSLLENVIDQILNANANAEEEEGYTFKPLKEIPGLEELEKSYDTFTPEEKGILEGLVEEKGYIHANNEKYESILGKTFVIIGSPEKHREIPLYGLDQEVILSEEERADLEKGISLGGLIFLYLVAIQDYDPEEEDDTEDDETEENNAEDDENAENAEDDENAENSENDVNENAEEDENAENSENSENNVNENAENNAEEE